MSLAEVEVEGLDPAQLPEVRQLQHPVAPLLGAASLYGAVTVPPDPDGVVRGLPHLVSYTPREGERAPAALHAAGRGDAPGGHAQAALRGRPAATWATRFSVPMDESGYSLVRWDAPEVGRGARGSVYRAIPAWNVLLNLFDVREGVPPRAAHDLEGRARRPHQHLAPGDGLQAHAHRRGDARGRHARAVAGEHPAVRGHHPRHAAAGPLPDPGAGLPRRLPRAHLQPRPALGAAACVLYLGARGGGGRGLRGVACYVFVEQLLWIADGGPAAGHGGHLPLHHRLRLRAPSGRCATSSHNALGRYVSPEVARLVTRDLRC